MKTIIFSDVHLNVSDAGSAKRASFTAFLRSIDPKEVNRLIVLGDLFDFWFEYKHVVFSGYFEVLRAFADLRDGGVEFHFVCGNHDLWAGRFLRETLGFQIHRGHLSLEFNGKRVLFVHGDGINPRDVSYRVYKRIARAAPVVRLFRLLHPDWAMALARWVSRGSRRLFMAEDLSRGAEVEPLRRFARDTLARGDADVVLCGHSHYPVQETYPTPNGPGTYINTGDWLFHESYVEWDGDTFEIKRFPSASAAEEVSPCKG